jgi:Fe(3+) dicitrate transport protein
MRNHILLLFSLIITGFSATAQNGTIEGRIILKDSLTGLSGVNIQLLNTKLGAVTTSKGNYKILDVPAGTYAFSATSVGYSKIVQEVVVKANETTNLSFVMREFVLDLPDVVIQGVTLTGGHAGIREIPGSAHYISPKEIEKFSYTDINRTLRAIPGVNLQEEDGFGLRPNIGLRGTGVERTSKITIMEDGVLMAPAPYSAPAAYYFPTIGRMHAVEILKGSSQIKYGPYTTGGAINLISSQIPQDFSGKVTLLGGSFNGRNLHANVGNSHKNFAYMAETFQFGSDGFKKLDNGGNTGFKKQDYLVKFRVNTNPTAKIYQSLSLKGAQTNELSNETYLGLTAADFEATPMRRYAGSQRDEMTTRQTHYTATHFIQPLKILGITTTAYYTDFSRNWYKLDGIKDSTGTKTSISNVLENPNDFGDSYRIITGGTSSLSDALFVKANNRNYNSLGVQTVLNFNFNTGKLVHKVDAGLRYHKDEMDRYQLEDKYRMVDGNMLMTTAGIPGTESNALANAKAVAAYVQYQLSFGKFTATPGIRYENMELSSINYGKTDPERTGINAVENKNFVDVWIPGIGLDYRYNDFGSVFTGIHKGFAPPGANPATRPEESINYEMGTRYQKNGISGQAVLFYNDYANLLGSDLAASGGAGTGDLFNGGRAESKGVEFQLTYDPLYSQDNQFSLPVTVVYTYTDARFKSSFNSSFEDWGAVASGDHLPYLANHQFTFMVSLDHKKFSLNVSGRFTSDMRAQAGQGEIPDKDLVPSWFVVDASGTYHVHKNISFFANATNLTNEIYIAAMRPAGLRPGMPRAFNVGVKARF